MVTISITVHLSVFQPNPAAAVAPAQGPTYILPWQPEYLYTTPPGGAHTQMLDLTDNSMLEQAQATTTDVI